MPATAIRWSSAPAPPSPPSRSSSASTGRLGRRLSAGRQGAGAQLAVHQRQACRDLRAHPEGGEAGGGGREAEIERARRAWSQGFVAETIDAFCRSNEVMDVSGRRHKGVLTAQDMAQVAADAGGAGPPRLRQLSRAEAACLDAGPGAAADAGAAQGLRPRQARPRPTRFRAYLGRVRQARLRRSRGLLRRSRSSSTCRCRRCCRKPTTPSGASWWATQASHGAAARQDRGLRRPRDRQGRARGRAPVPASRRSRRLQPAMVPTSSSEQQRQGDRRHRPHRHHRQGRQHVHRHAVGRLAAVLAGDPGARVAARLARADVLAGRGTARLARARQAAALDAVGRHGLRDGKPYMSWGTPGGDQQDQWSCQFFLRHASQQRHAEDEPAGGDRRAGLAHRALPAVVLAAHRAPRRAGGRGPPAEGHHQGAGASRPQGRGRPRLVRRPPSAASQDGVRRKAAANPRGMQGYAAGR